MLPVMTPPVLFWKNVGDGADLEVPSTSVSNDYYTSGWNKM